MLGLHLLGNPRAEQTDLLDEFFPNILVGYVWQILQFIFLFHGSDKGVTVSIPEEVFDQSPDPVFSFCLITAAFLLGETSFEVLLGCDEVAILIFQLETEISQHPEESRKMFRHFLNIVIRCIVSHLQNFR